MPIDKPELIQRIASLEESSDGLHACLNTVYLLRDYINDPEITKAVNELEAWFNDDPTALPGK